MVCINWAKYGPCNCVYVSIKDNAGDDVDNDDDGDDEATVLLSLLSMLVFMAE